MSLTLKIPEAQPNQPPAHPLYKLSDNELRLRAQFVAAFNDTMQSGWELHVAVLDVVDELKARGESVDDVVERIKYVAAIPIAFHYRVGYRSGHAQLTEAGHRAIALANKRYFVSP